MKKIIIAALLGLITAGFISLARSNLLAIKKVVVKLNNSPCASEDDIRKAVKLERQNISFTSQSSLEKKLKKDFLCIDNLKLYKHFPQDVELAIEGRKALLAINLVEGPKPLELKIDSLEATPSSQSAFFTRFTNLDSYFASEGASLVVDKGGLVFATTSAGSNLPEIFMVNIQLSLGQRISKETVTSVLEIIDKLKELQLSIDKAIVQRNYLIIKSGGIKVFFNLEKNVDQTIASLQLLLQKSKIDSSSFESIDLRFDKPVVVYSKKK